MCFSLGHVQLDRVLNFLGPTIHCGSEANVRTLMATFCACLCFPSHHLARRDVCTMFLFVASQTAAEGSNLYGLENSNYPVLETYAEGGTLEVRIVVSTYHWVSLVLTFRCSLLVVVSVVSSFLWRAVAAAAT